MGVTLRSNRNVVFRCAFHVVWCSKWRRPVLIGPVEARLKEILSEAIAEGGAWLVELEVMPDHVHLLVECDPQFGVSRLVRKLRGRSSRLLRHEFPSLRAPSLWSNSYFVTTVGGAPLDVVKRYVGNQKTAMPPVLW